MARKPKKKSLDKQCLALWAKLVKHGGRCELCGNQPKVLHAHHLIHRNNRRFRYDIENGIALCCRCHLFDGDCSAHAGTDSAYNFLERLHAVAGAKWEYFMAHKDIKPVVKLDIKALQEVLDDLTEQWNSLHTKW